MLIKSFTGVTEISSLLFHKPVSQIVVVENFNYKDAIPYPQTNVPFARIRLVDGFQGKQFRSSTQNVINTPLGTIEQI